MIKNEKTSKTENKIYNERSNEEYNISKYVKDNKEYTIMSFKLNNIYPKILKYFGEEYYKNYIKNEKKKPFHNKTYNVEMTNLLTNIENLIKNNFNKYDIQNVENEYIQIIIENENKNIDNIINEILETIRNYYEKDDYHITRMFGSYILLKNIDGNLTAINSTPIPIKYCPLMIQLLKEVGGCLAEDLIESLKTNDDNIQKEMMCKLINEVVIKGGYFDTNRALNSCENNVLFGASETMSSAFKSKIIDAAVIVSNNLGTIITTNDSNTQGAVKRMTGLFHTSPSKKLIQTAKEANIDVVFPYTGSIDQLQGVKKAIKLGYKKIAVSVAADDNYLHKALKELETDEIKIYKFGLCSTGITNETAQIMKEYADVVWSCASKQVKEYIEPNSIAQVGIKIPVHIMTKDGWEIINNHLKYMDNNFNSKEIQLANNEETPVILNSKGQMKLLKRKELKKCMDCPYPCV